MENKKKSIFRNIPKLQFDPIITIMELYKKSENPDKINLTVGAYRTEELKPHVFTSVRKAEEDLVTTVTPTRSYLHPLGDTEYNFELAKLIFPIDSEVFTKNRIFSCQSLSGTGALKLIANYLSSYAKKEMKHVYIPSPTWSNHNILFLNAGCTIEEYFFYDDSNLCINFEYMRNFLLNTKEGSSILFHTCAFNPTGSDFTHEQWREVLVLVKEKNLFCIFDTAYQGFASGDLEEDIFPIKLFEKNGIEYCICQSLAKSMGLYGERAGAMHIVYKDQGSIEDNIKLNSKLSNVFTDIVLSCYLVPIAYGSDLIKIVLTKYKDEWINELKIVVGRIKNMRKLLYKELVSINAPGNWSTILEQKGMFAYTGLSVSQCEYLIYKKSLYLVCTGRISVCGINHENVKKIAEYIKEAKELE